MVVVVDTSLVVPEVATALVELTVAELEVDAAVVEVEAELCSLELALALETLDAALDVVETVEGVVVLAVDEDATIVAVVVEVIGGVADGELALATSPSRTATMTAAPALAPTFPY